MAKHPHDFKTAELVGIPEAKRRGRPPLNGVAMTPAERKRASRAAMFDRYKVELSCQISETAMNKLRDRAKMKDLSIGELVELLVGDL